MYNFVFIQLFQVELSATRIAELEDLIKDLREENLNIEESANKAMEKEKRAKEKIMTLTSENNSLKELGQHPSSNYWQQEIESQMVALRAEKDHQIEELIANNERLQLHIEQLQNVSRSFDFYNLSWNFI